MNTSLKISNYALIEHLDISFDPGMTCITGETGAGKSILMGGLGLVLGKRVDMSVLKDNQKKCVIEASFLIDKYNLEGFFEFMIFSEIKCLLLTISFIVLVLLSNIL